MTRRNYGQSCSVAGALDRIGERWSLLIVRELLLGPLRFSDLIRAVGDAPTDSVARRLRDFEADGIVQKRELGPPASTVVYELTPLGRELEAPLLELGRWGLNFFRVENIPGIESSWLPNSLRVILRPPRDVVLTLQLHSEDQSFTLYLEDGRISAERGEVTDPDLTLNGSPRGVIAALVGGEGGEGEVEIEGDRAVLQALREMVVLPERLRAEALTEIAGQLAAA